MKLWVVIPVKPFHESKSRLHDVLDGEQRAALSQALLANILETINAFVDQLDVDQLDVDQLDVDQLDVDQLDVDQLDVAGILVISRDEAVLAVARAMGAIVLTETGHDLNNALYEARQHATQSGADALLVLPSDLPLLTVDDLQDLCSAGVEQPGVVIPRSRDGGTNALLLRPPHAIDFAFGPQSFRRHRQLARETDQPCHIVESTSLGFDIDWPRDLRELAVLRS